MVETGHGEGLAEPPKYDSSYYSELRPDRFGAEATKVEAEFAIRALGLPDGSLILDEGCGNGRHLKELQARFRMVGIDCSAEMVAEAQTRLDGLEVELVQADMRDLPFVDGSFDGAVNLFSSWGFFDDKENELIIEETARVLRPEGVFVLDYGNIGSYFANFRDNGHLREGIWRMEELGPKVNRVVSWDVRNGRFSWQYKSHEGELLGEAMHQATYSSADIHGMMLRAGLEPSGEWGGYSGTEFEESTSSRRIIRAVKAQP